MPPSLAVLGGKDYLGPIDPRMTLVYQVVWREEIVVLAIMLQRCAICASVSPDMLCGAVQETHDCLVPVVERGELFNMEEIWEEVKDPIATTPSNRVPSPVPGVEQLTGTTTPDLYLHLNWKRLHFLRTWPWCKGGGHHHPLGFLPWTWMTL